VVKLVVDGLGAAMNREGGGQLERRCKACERVLPIGAFGVMSAAKDGRNQKCKECVRSYNKAMMELRHRRMEAAAEASRARPGFLEETPEGWKCVRSVDVGGVKLRVGQVLVNEPWNPRWWRDQRNQWDVEPWSIYEPPDKTRRRGIPESWAHEIFAAAGVRVASKVNRMIGFGEKSPR
jgi:hypothetical protein